MAALFGTLFAGSPPATLGVRDGRLAPCPDRPNCVSSEATDDAHRVAALDFAGDPAAALRRLDQVIAGQDGASIVTRRDGYLHAEFTTRLLGFVDDFEARLDAAAGVIGCAPRRGSVTATWASTAGASRPFARRSGPRRNDDRRCRGRDAEPPGRASVLLKPGREKSLRQRHPWIFSGAIDRSTARRPPAPPSTSRRRTAHLSPAPRTRRRRRSAPASGRSMRASRSMRRSSRAASRAPPRRAPRCSTRWHTGCRLIHGESDGLPGVVADRYARHGRAAAVVGRRGRWRDAIAAALAEPTGAGCVYERSDADVRKLEGLAPRIGVAARHAAGRGEVRRGRARVPRRRRRRPEDRLLSRPARRTGPRVRALAAGREVLNVFCYTGGFTLAALAGGAARVVSIDSSADALALARENLALQPGAPRRPRRHGAKPTCSPSCASCATAAPVSISSCSIRRSSRRPPRTPSAPRAPTRTSTCWR